MARPRTSPQPEVPGLAARRIAADILDGVLRRQLALDEQLAGKGAHPGLAALADRDRALMRRLVATVLRRLGTLRHLLGGFLDKRLSRRRAARRNHPADRRGANPVARRARSCRGRSFGAAGAGRPPRRALCRPGQRRAAPRRAERATRSLRRLDATRDTPAWLLARWTQDLRRRDRARDRARQRPRAGARSHRQERRRALGRAAARPRAADRHGAHAGAWRDLAAARLCRRRLVGAGRRRRAAGAAARRCARASASPTCAPRPAARPRSSRWPARASPRSTARRRGSRGCARISTRLGAHGRDRRRRRAGMAGRAVRRRAARRAVLVDRHHPPPSRRALAQERGRHRRAHRAAAAPARPRRRPAQARRHARLLRLLARAGGRRAADRGAAGAQPARCAASRSPPARSSATPNSSAPRATCARCRCILPDPDPRWGGLDGFYAARLRAQSNALIARICGAYWPCRRPFAIVLPGAAESAARRGTEHAQ